MKKLVLSVAFMLCMYPVFAQDGGAGNDDDTKKEEAPKDGWNTFGTFSLLFNQAAFNADWAEGGLSSLGGNAHIDFNFNYRKADWTWDNKVIAEYGVIKTEGDEKVRKTVDKFEIYSVAGKQIEESNWFYSAFLNFKTQFGPGYDYEETTFTDPVSGKEVTTFDRGEKTTHMFSPADIQLGLGFLWKKSDNLKVNIAPATARLTIVDDMYTSEAGYVDGDYYGVDYGKSTLFQFGAAINAYAKIDVMENFAIENILALYSNYLEDPQNVDIDYTLRLKMKVNKYLSANFTFQAIYDDNVVSAFQVREVLGVGFSYDI